MELLKTVNPKPQDAFLDSMGGVEAHVWNFCQQHIYVGATVGLIGCRVQGLGFKVLGFSVRGEPARGSSVPNIAQKG